MTGATDAGAGAAGAGPAELVVGEPKYDGPLSGRAFLEYAFQLYFLRAG